MIVAKAETGQIIIGLCDADIAELRKKLTKTKQGGPQWGFKSLIVFYERTPEALEHTLNQAGAKRHDDLFPNTGSG